MPESLCHLAEQLRKDINLLALKQHTPSLEHWRTMLNRTEQLTELTIIHIQGVKDGTP